MHIRSRISNIALIVGSCFIGFSGFSQKPVKFRHVRIRDQRETYGKTIMYGSVVQVFGAWGGGGITQFFYLYNIDSNRYYFFDASPPSRKQNFFRRYVPAGNYALMKFQWGHNIDDIYKQGRMTNNVHLSSPLPYVHYDEAFEQKLEDRYHFYIAPDTTTYVGEWHVENTEVFFTNNKTIQDSIETFVTVRRKLDLTRSAVNIPK